jgi:hypothetical protein
MVSRLERKSSYEAPSSSLCLSPESLEEGLKKDCRQKENPKGDKNGNVLEKF